MKFENTEVYNFEGAFRGMRNPLNSWSKSDSNFDGYNKSRTTIGKDVFVGSGSIIIAPLEVKDNAFIAAGSTLNKDVEEDALAIARCKQENKVGYSRIIKARAKAKKENK